MNSLFRIMWNKNLLLKFASEYPLKKVKENKVKLSLRFLFLTEHDAIKAYWGVEL
jgi:hypothetical protein